MNGMHAMKHALFALLVAAAVGAAHAQTLQKGIDLSKQRSRSVEIEYISYRPVKYETEFLQEVANERPNQGGFITVYYRNVSEEQEQLRFWRANQEDESHWRLGGFLAWDRTYDHTLSPGELGVTEINAVSEDFAEGEAFSFGWIGNGWASTGFVRTELHEDAVQVALIRVLPGMQDVEVHVRNRSGEPLAIQSLEFEGMTVESIEWVGGHMEGNGHAIARARLARPYNRSELIIAKLGLSQDGETRTIYSHRRAFEDWFPIGCWSNRPEWYDRLASLHIDFFVADAPKDSAFTQEIAPKYGFRVMTWTTEKIRESRIDALGGHDVLAAWMLKDEPDWSIAPNIMNYQHESVRAFTNDHPTLLTLCRNVKFFEYAQIADIPVHDHYCVGAPTSSKWPHIWGTRLEETGYYTRDLKYAAEPKPIWVWSQAIDGWDERPQRPVPTPSELLAQLMFNLGQGAKGIIWFNYNLDIAERFPDTEQAMREWGRVMKVTRHDWLGSEKLDAKIEGPDKLDKVALATWDGVIAVLTNSDYELDPAAYKFSAHEDVTVAVPLPAWVEPNAVFAVDPEGIQPLPYEAQEGAVSIEAGRIETARLILIKNDADAAKGYAAAHAEAIAWEKQHLAAEAAKAGAR